MSQTRPGDNAQVIKELGNENLTAAQLIEQINKFELDEKADENTNKPAVEAIAKFVDRVAGPAKDVDEITPLLRQKLNPEFLAANSLEKLGAFVEKLNKLKAPLKSDNPLRKKLQAIYNVCSDLFKELDEKIKTQAEVVAGLKQDNLTVAELIEQIDKFQLDEKADNNDESRVAAMAIERVVDNIVGPLVFPLEEKSFNSKIDALIQILDKPIADKINKTQTDIYHKYSVPALLEKLEKLEGLYGKTDLAFKVGVLRSALWALQEMHDKLLAEQAKVVFDRLSKINMEDLRYAATLITRKVDEHGGAVDDSAIENLKNMQVEIDGDGYPLKLKLDTPEAWLIDFQDIIPVSRALRDFYAGIIGLLGKAGQDEAVARATEKFSRILPEGIDVEDLSVRLQLMEKLWSNFQSGAVFPEEVKGKNDERHDVSPQYWSFVMLNLITGAVIHQRKAPVAAAPAAALDEKGQPAPALPAAAAAPAPAAPADQQEEIPFNEAFAEVRREDFIWSWYLNHAREAIFKSLEDEGYEGLLIRFALEIRQEQEIALDEPSPISYTDKRVANKVLNKVLEWHAMAGEQIVHEARNGRRAWSEPNSIKRIARENDAFQDIINKYLLVRQLRNNILRHPNMSPKDKIYQSGRFLGYHAAALHKRRDPLLEKAFRSVWARIEGVFRGIIYAIRGKGFKAGYEQSKRVWVGEEATHAGRALTQVLSYAKTNTAYMQGRQIAEQLGQDNIDLRQEEIRIARAKKALEDKKARLARAGAEVVLAAEQKENLAREGEKLVGLISAQLDEQVIRLSNEISRLAGGSPIRRAGMSTTHALTEKEVRKRVNETYGEEMKAIKPALDSINEAIQAIMANLRADQIPNLNSTAREQIAIDVLVESLRGNEALRERILHLATLATHLNQLSPDVFGAHSYYFILLERAAVALAPKALAAIPVAPHGDHYVPGPGMFDHSHDRSAPLSPASTVSAASAARTVVNVDTTAQSATVSSAENDLDVDDVMTRARAITKDMKGSSDSDSEEDERMIKELEARQRADAVNPGEQIVGGGPRSMKFGRRGNE